MINFGKKSVLLVALILTLGLSACSSNDKEYYGEAYDPLESYNRMVFSFNQGVDYIILDPLTEAYRFIVPDPFRLAISNFITNIKSPVYFINELLQGDWEGMSVVAQRFVFNTFTGFGGIVDTASWEGITYEPEDFGQTLAVWGVGAGPYLVMPIFGPTTVRDGFGTLADMALDPVNWYIWNHDKDDLGLAYTGTQILTTKDRILDVQKDLKKNSLDYYAATRSVWLQRRQTLINDGDATGGYDDYE